MPLLTRKAWYGPSSVGSLFPMPKSWEGWVALIVFIIVIAATAALAGDLGKAARIGVCIAYVVLCYVTYDRDA